LPSEPEISQRAVPRFSPIWPRLIRSSARKAFRSKNDSSAPLEVHQYPDTGHWFFEWDRPDAYNRAAAELAWQPTIDFFARVFAPGLGAHAD
jgi:dienelactone hydrolase